MTQADTADGENGGMGYGGVGSGGSQGGCYTTDQGCACGTPGSGSCSCQGTSCHDEGGGVVDCWDDANGTHTSCWLTDDYGDGCICQTSSNPK